MLVRLQTNPKEVEKDAEDGDGGDGEYDAGEAGELAPAYNSQQDEDGVDVEGVALDAGGQEVALELLDQGVGDDHQDHARRRGLYGGRGVLEDGGHDDGRYPPDKRAEVRDDRGRRDPGAEQDGVGHVEQVERGRGQRTLDHHDHRQPAEVSTKRLAEGVPQVAGVAPVGPRRGPQVGGLDNAHVHQQVDPHEEHPEEGHPEPEGPRDEPDEAPQQILREALRAIEEVVYQPLPERLRVRARHQLALVEDLDQVKQQPVDPVRYDRHLHHEVP